MMKQRSAQHHIKLGCNRGTVPYEWGNFADSKIDNFSLIFKTSLKIIGMFYDVNAKTGKQIDKSLKKFFKAKTTIYRKA